MNSAEREQLNQFLRQLVEVKLNEKDQEAQQLIAQAMATQPDAAYLLVQRCLLADQALQAAQTQIADLQQRAQQPSNANSGNSFLGGNPWVPASSGAVPGGANYQVPNRRGMADASLPPQAAAANQSAGSGFLSNIATTAAGVVAGSFLMHGIGNLLGHHSQPSPWGEHDAGEHLSEQTVVNNYYGDSDAGLADNDGFQQAAYSVDNEQGDLMDDSDFDSDWV